MMAEAFASSLDPWAAPRVTVLGVGNVILRDEGFGVRVVEHLDAHYTFADENEIRLIDGGTLGMELLRFVQGTEKLLIVDALKGRDGDVPGAVYRFAGEDVAAHFRDKLSSHEIGIHDILQSYELTGKPVPEVVVIGAVPEALDAGMTLSKTLAARVAHVAEMALSELRAWGIAAQARACAIAQTEVKEAPQRS